MSRSPRLIAACVCLAAGLSSRPTPGAIVQIQQYELKLTDAGEAARRAEWSDPDLVRVHPDGLGWGDAADAGAHDVRLRTTEPFALGLSWRPTSAVTIRARVDQPADADSLFARYSADAKHWTTWQYLGSTAPAAAGAGPRKIEATLRVPRADRVRYEEFLDQYLRREDVPWRSDEEAMVAEVVSREPDFFATATPFIGYVQFLYEGRLPAGRRLKGLAVDMSWGVGGLHMAPKDRSEEARRDVPWRFKAP